LSDSGRSVPMVLSQSYQLVTGTAGETRVEQGRLSGDHIRFLAIAGAGRRVYEGRVEGNRIVPLAANAGWHAERSG
jgi:hypothetical protein